MSLSIASTVELSNGVAMPLLGLGTFMITDESQIHDAVLTAVETGYRLIDTASIYKNEEAIGRALRDSGIAREEIFLTTKCWNDEQGYQAAREAFERSCDRLNVGYVDLYLVHWPAAEHYAGTWRALEELYADGRVRAIGVSNFLSAHLEELAKVANIAPMVNQVEFHPRLQEPELVKYCQSHNIQIQAWAPLMRGAIGEVTEILQIARNHGKTPAQVTLRWLLQRGIGTIPKSVHSSRIVENAAIFDFELAEAECALIDSLDSGLRTGRHPDSWGLT
ncbi:MAG: aldo/keto reductase [Actinobacteria bacterium]|nr:aldo/keto reductase [Actinomycetota bacterium]